MLKLFKYLSLLFLLVVIIISTFYFSVYYGFFGTLPTQNELKAIQNEEASLVFSSDQLVIGKYFAQNRTNIRWEDIPKHLVNALIATEDRRFFSHKGYDTYSYFRVLFKSILLKDNSGGGSTITQQLIKNLYGRQRFGLLTFPVNKIKEAIIATRMEQIYSKEELLLLYLNSVPFGEDVYGIESAAQRFFSKKAKELKIEESAVLVAMLKANTTYNPALNPENSKKRRNLVLNLMASQRYISSKEADSLKRLPLVVNYEKLNSAPAGYFVQQVRKTMLQLLDSINNARNTHYDLEKDGLRIYTTLNMEIQEITLKSVAQHLFEKQKILDKELENRKIKKQWLFKQKQASGEDFDKDLNPRKVSLFDWKGVYTANISKYDSLWHYYKMLHAAVLISNPKDGAVICWIGGNHFQMLPFDMVLAHRQSASAFKPILYASAVENGYTPCTYLENKQKIYEEFENWEPENFDKSSTPDSTVAFWYALAHSMNLPSVDLYFKLGREKLLNTCKKLELPEYNGESPALALGALDVSLNEMVRAYSSFANNGSMNELYMIQKITDASGNKLYMHTSENPSKVLDTLTCTTITAMLQQVVNRGTAAEMRGRYGINTELAGKTGTAQNFTDAWFVAYTPNLVLGTWVGASTPEVHFFTKNGSGSALAMPIIANIISTMKQKPDFQNNYFTSFHFSEKEYEFLQCEPYRNTAGIKGFFEKLFRREESLKTDTSDRGVRSFFRKIFGKKKNRE